MFFVTPARKFCLTVAVLSALFAAHVDAADAPTSARGPATRQLGDLELRSPSGDPVSLIPYITRKAIVVVFWAAWCPVCRAEAARINQLSANPNVKVIAVNEGDSAQLIKDFMNTYKVNYQVVVDPVSDIAKSFGVPGMPYCVIIGRTGVVVHRAYKLPEDLDYYIK